MSDSTFDFYVVERDYTPKAGRRLHACFYPKGREKAAVAAALRDLNENATEGQSLVHNPVRGTVGYAIKYQGQPAYFEAAKQKCV